MVSPRSHKWPREIRKFGKWLVRRIRGALECLDKTHGARNDRLNQFRLLSKRSSRACCMGDALTHERHIRTFWEQNVPQFQDDVKSVKGSSRMACECDMLNSQMQQERFNQILYALSVSLVLASFASLTTDQQTIRFSIGEELPPNPQSRSDLDARILSCVCGPRHLPTACSSTDVHPLQADTVA